MNQQVLKQKLRQKADQCVKCGLCLPHCPTYRLRQDEGESPRGRIALIQGLAEGRLADSERLQAHLASCLECRACETVCPSLVQFGSLMDGARALGNLHSSRWRRMYWKGLLGVLSSAAGNRIAAASALLYRSTGLARLAEWSGLARLPSLKAYLRLAVQLEPPRNPPDQAGESAAPGREIDLFLGCIARTAQPRAIQAAHRVLDHLGFQVRVSRGQGCCGAMFRHNGYPDEADRLLARAAATASGTVVGIASACVAELRTHTHLADAHEICRFLADLQWARDQLPRPLAKRVAVHEPCSQRNQLRDSRAAYDLLKLIPQIETRGLADNAFCCGAAGTYLLQQPAVSQALLAPKLEALAELGAEILVTTNTGCALHLAAGVREAGLAIEVVHPVELLARQVGD